MLNWYKIKKECNLLNFFIVLLKRCLYIPKIKRIKSKIYVNFYLSLITILLLNNIIMLYFHRLLNELLLIYLCLIIEYVKKIAC